ncbi:MAG: methyltransferase domain-containing protein [Thioploca sp.]|nr:methyltransferase domain-containing protein [Thioploca sp.]
MSKSTGSYYTPRKLSAFIWEHALKSFEQHQPLHILEPSCGEGIFLQAASEYQRTDDLFLDAIEINPDTLKKTQEALSQKNGYFKANFIEDDFLKVKLSQKYDLIIGTLLILAGIYYLSNKENCASKFIKKEDLTVKVSQIYGQPFLSKPLLY